MTRAPAGLCRLCDLLEGLAPYCFVDDLPAAKVIVHPGTLFAGGHFLVISKVHVTDLTEDPAAAGTVMTDAASFAGSLHGPCNIVACLGEAAGQSVGHLCLHVVAREAGDGLALPFPAGGLA